MVWEAWGGLGNFGMVWMVWIVWIAGIAGGDGVVREFLGFCSAKTFYMVLNWFILTFGTV